MPAAAPDDRPPEDDPAPAVELAVADPLIAVGVTAPDPVPVAVAVAEPVLTGVV